MDIQSRKQNHIDAVLSGRVSMRNKHNGFSDFDFIHQALPEVNLHDVNLHQQFLGFDIDLPFIISSMTGGVAQAKYINEHLSEAAGELNIPMAVGSQRISALGYSTGLDFSLRTRMGNTPLFGNIGAAQLLEHGVEDCKRLVDSIGADGLFVHLNPLQEAVQDNGDTNWLGITKRIEALCRAIEVPVLVKEVGFGISLQCALSLHECGVAAIDVAGAGGTSWSAVEGWQHKDSHTRALTEQFRDWGIPTREALSLIHQQLPQIPLIASGGMNNAIDCAKALHLGASLVGQAGAILPAAIDSTESVVKHFSELAKALSIVCFVTGSKDLSALRHCQVMPVRR